jgi:DNA-directed RNA polymerase subunit RPC12/RpoP
MYINEYVCNDCEREIKIVLDGVNSENVSCPFCKSDDVNFMDHEQLV